MKLIALMQLNDKLEHNETVLRHSHPQKHCFPSRLTDDGRGIDSTFSQSSNAWRLIEQSFDFAPNTTRRIERHL
jgi:hypothetical protein